MNAACATQRHRLEMQGYIGFTDKAYAEFGGWTRLAPGLCVLIGMTGTTLTSEYIIWGLAVVALLGASMPIHPFDVLYNRTVRPLLGTAELPHHGRPRRFACTVAFLWLVGTGAAFALGAIVTGVVFGILFVIIAGIPVVTGFCVPSYLFGLYMSVRDRRHGNRIASGEISGGSE